jgi:glutaredoxin 2
MDTMSEERMQEIEIVKKEVTKKNVNAVAELLLDTRQHNFEVQQELGELRKLVTQNMQAQQQLKSELDMTRAQLFSLMGNGEMGN